jgi:hypothetical protein
MPTVSIHDVVIHPLDGDLIAATHGRGIWIMDDISPLQQMTTTVQQAEAHLFQSRPAIQWYSINPQHGGGNLAFRGENPTRNAIINYYLSDKVTGDVKFDVTDVGGTGTCSASFRPRGRHRAPRGAMLDAQPGAGGVGGSPRRWRGPEAVACGGAAGGGAVAGGAAGGGAARAAGAGPRWWRRLQGGTCGGGAAPPCRRRIRAAADAAVVAADAAAAVALAGSAGWPKICWRPTARSTRARSPCGRSDDRISAPEAGRWTARDRCLKMTLTR